MDEKIYDKAARLIESLIRAVYIVQGSPLGLYDKHDLSSIEDGVSSGSMYLNRNNKSSSFPSLLMQYNTPSVAKQVHWSRRTKEEERSKGIRQSGDDLEKLENIVEKKVTTEMRALKLEAIAREQLARYDKYIQRLNDKVARQRAEMKRRTEETETRILAQEQQGRRERKVRKTQPLPPINSPDHFKKYPKTKFSKTVLLGDDMKRKGLLRCQQEVDRFWHINMFGHRWNEAT